MYTQRKEVNPGFGASWNAARKQENYPRGHPYECHPCIIAACACRAAHEAEVAAQALLRELKARRVEPPVPLSDWDAWLTYLRTWLAEEDEPPKSIRYHRA